MDFAGFLDLHRPTAETEDAHDQMDIDIDDGKSEVPKAGGGDSGEDELVDEEEMEIDDRAEAEREGVSRVSPHHDNITYTNDSELGSAESKEKTNVEKIIKKIQPACRPQF